MKQIIKRGTWDTCTCISCGCLFSYEQEDVCISSKDGFKEYVTCPQCNAEHIFVQSKGLR